jgi:predicted transcriptional regulator
MEDKDLLNNVGFILASKKRYAILKMLHNNMSTPTELSHKLNFSVNHVSNILKELSNKKFISCETPSLRKGRIYSITKKGKIIFMKIKNL